MINQRELFLFVVICVFKIIQGQDNGWIKPQLLTVCAMDDVMISFTYHDPALSFQNFSQVTWVVRKTPDAKQNYIMYYTAQSKKIQFPPGDTSYEGRVEWKNNTFNFKLKQVSSNDSGFYDMQFTVFNAGTHYSTSKTNTVNGTFQLRVNDPCIKATTVDGGCSELTCSTGQQTPVYSWKGVVSDSSEKTVRVCPEKNQNYTCCVDQEKLKCMNVFVEAADTKDEGGSNVGMIVGIVVGVIAVAVIVAVVIICKKRSAGGYQAAKTSG